MATQNGGDREGARAEPHILEGTAQQELRPPTFGADPEINVSDGNRIAPAQPSDTKKATSVSHGDFIGLYQIYWDKVAHDDAHANSRAERGMIFQGFLLTAYTFLYQATQKLESYDALRLWIPWIGLIACVYTMVGICLSIIATYRLGSRLREVRDAWKQWQKANSDVQLPLPRWGTGGDCRGWHTAGVVFGPWASIAFFVIWLLILYGS